MSDFPLQRRYEIERNGEPCFVLREHLTVEERREISERLRREGEAYLKLAHAQKEQTDALIELGELTEGPDAI
jgi:hypothetical protein